MFDHTIAIVVTAVGLATFGLAWVTLHRQINADKATQRARDIRVAINEAELQRLRDRYEPREGERDD